MPPREHAAAAIDPSTHQSLSFLAIALWFGLATGLVEGAAFLFLQHADWLNWTRVKEPVAVQILWVAPLFDAIIFAAIGAMIALAARLAPGLVTTARAVLLLTAIAVYDWLALSGHLYRYGVIILAIGVAVVLTRWFRPRETAIRRVWQRSLLPLVLMTVLIFAVVEAGEWRQERKVTAQLPAARAGAPNILVLVVDTLRADHLSTYGYQRATSPNIDALGQHGVVFENAFATSSWTLPSHGSLVTGRYPHEHEADKRPLDDRYPTIGEALNQRGYRTGAFSGNVYFFNRRQGFGRGFIHFEDYFCSPADMFMRTLFGREIGKYVLTPLGVVDIIGRKRAPDINDAVLRWLDRPTGHPFFVFVNYMDVHDPYLPPAPYRTAFTQTPQRGGLLLSGADSYPQLTPEQVQGEMDAYDGAIAYTDHHIGQLLAALDQRALLDNTIVILTSDHGEAFGEHGLYLHQNALYRELIRVPLIVVDRRNVPSGVRVAAPVSNAALPVTLMELIGAPDSAVFPQSSLAQLWQGSAPPSDPPHPLAELGHYPFGPRQRPSRHGAMKSVVTAEWQYITHEKFGAELYDWHDDPAELHNLVAEPRLQTTVAECAAQLQLASVPR